MLFWSGGGLAKVFYCSYNTPYSYRISFYNCTERGRHLLVETYGDVKIVFQNSGGRMYAKTVGKTINTDNVLTFKKLLFSATSFALFKPLIITATAL